MHELAIAYELVEIAENAARGANAERVTVVRLRLGVFSGVVKEALWFGYDTATQGTLLEGSQLEIEDVPLVMACADCGQQSTALSIQDLRCPVCGSSATTIEHGKELELTSMEIVDHANATA